MVPRCRHRVVSGLSTSLTRQHDRSLDCDDDGRRGRWRTVTIMTAPGTRNALHVLPRSLRTPSTYGSPGGGLIPAEMVRMDAVWRCAVRLPPTAIDHTRLPWLTDGLTTGLVAVGGTGKIDLYWNESYAVMEDGIVDALPDFAGSASITARGRTVARIRMTGSGAGQDDTGRRQHRNVRNIWAYGGTLTQQSEEYRVYSLERYPQRPSAELQLDRSVELPGGDRQ